MQLSEYRKQLDDIDGAIISLLAQRFEVTRQVGELKKSHHMPAQDPAREQRQMERIAVLASDVDLNIEMTRCVFRVIIDQVVAEHKIIQGEEK